MIGSVDGMEGRSVTVFAVTTGTFIVATIFVGLRMLSRGWIVKKITLDDYIMLAAWLLAFGVAFAICYGATVGLGRHDDEVPDSWEVPLRKSQYAFSVLYQPALMTEKSSILVFYLSLTRSNRVFRWATIATLVVVNCAGLALTLFTIFQCKKPSNAFEYPRPPDAKCTDIVTIYLSSSPANIISDIAILLLPMPILTGMRLPMKQKIILVITFSFGAFVAIVDVVRVAYLQSASTYRLAQIKQNGGANANSEMGDFSWYASLSFMWTAVEVNVGIMCACVPALKPLVTRFAPKVIHDTSLGNSRRPSSENTARMVEVQRIPSMPHVDFRHRDFAPQTPVGGRRPSSRPQPLTLDADMNMMEFLTTPDMLGSPGNNLRRTDTCITNTSRSTHAGTPTFFDFVNTQGKKSLVQMTTKESLFPITMVSVLFFIWGFEYGLLDVLNQQFQQVARMSAGQNVALHSAYFAGYFVGPLLVGRLVLKHWGFKACFNVGLAIYACGTLIFWVAAVLTSFPAYVIVNIIVGIGLSILETGANPFIALCGPQQYSEIRLNLSQGFQAIGTIVAPLIASKAFTQYSDDAPTLISTQWAYLGIALFTFALAFGYYYIPLPDATDSELEDASERLDHAHYAEVGGVRVIWYTLALGVFAQCCYVGAQEVNATNFEYIVLLVTPNADIANCMAYAHTAFAVARLVAAGLGFFIKPRHLLLFLLIGCIVSASLVMKLAGTAALALQIVSFFFEGPIFGLIFAQSLRGLGKHTKLGSVFITSAVSGGAVFPAIAFAVKQSHGPAYAMSVAVAAFAGAMLFPLALSLHPIARLISDPIWKPVVDHGPPTLPRATRESGLGISGMNHFGVKKRCEEDKDGSTDYRERHGSADTTASTPS